MNIKRFLAAVAMLLSLPAFAAPLYFNDFEANANGVTGPGFLAGSEGFSAYGFGGQYLRNASSGVASVLTINAGAGINGATLNLDVAMLDSWDGFNCCGPDFFNVSVDSNLVYSNIFSIFDGATSDPNLSLIVYGPNLAVSGWGDAAYNLSLNLGNLGAGNHTISFFASGDVWQAGDDESFAIDNVALNGERVASTDVPEPISGALLLAGLGAMAAIRRRK